MKKNILYSLPLLAILSSCSDNGVQGIQTETSYFKEEIKIDTTTPIFTSASDISVSEEQLEAITLLATDDNNISYRIDGGDSNSFNIDSISGLVSFNDKPSFEDKSIYSFEAYATDGTNEANQSVTISITNIIEITPQLDNPTANTIPENISIGSIVAKINSASDDIDSNDILGYSIVEGDTNRDFNISNSGVISINKALDFETTPNYDLSIIATNAKGDSSPISLSLTITNIIELAPLLSAISDITLSTYTPIGTDIASILTDNSSIDTNTIDSYSILSGNTDEDFTISSSGIISTSHILNNAKTPDYNIIINATNSAGTTPITIKIHISKPPISSIYYQSDYNSSALGALVSLSATSIMGDYPISGYEWEREGNIISSTKDMDINASTLGLGEHNITLTTTDTINLKSSKTITLKVYKTPIKNTNQTDSYNSRGVTITDNTIKDDGYYQSGLYVRYTRDDTKEVVIDYLTNLMWQDDTSSDFKDWNYASSYCSGLSLGGYTNWRLPSRNELSELIDFSKTNPAIDSKFVNTISDYYWTDTNSTTNSLNKFVIFMDSGRSHTNSKAFNGYIKCVR